MEIVSEKSVHQEQFDTLYIQSSEICRRLKVNRGMLCSARARGMLPGEISLNAGCQFIWDRTFIEPYLKAWETSLNARRG